MLIHFSIPVIQIRRGKRDNLGIIYDLSLEPSLCDSSNEWSQCMFSLRNKKKLYLNYPQYPLISGAQDYTLLEIKFYCEKKLCSFANVFKFKLLLNDLNACGLYQFKESLGVT